MKTHYVNNFKDDPEEFVFWMTKYHINFSKNEKRILAMLSDYEVKTEIFNINVEIIFDLLKLLKFNIKPHKASKENISMPISIIDTKIPQVIYIYAILKILNRPVTVEEVMEESEYHFNTVYKYLYILKSLGVIERKEGQYKIINKTPPKKSSQLIKRKSSKRAIPLLDPINYHNEEDDPIGNN